MEVHVQLVAAVEGDAEVQVAVLVVVKERQRWRGGIVGSLPVVGGWRVLGGWPVLGRLAAGREDSNIYLDLIDCQVWQVKFILSASCHNALPVSLKLPLFRLAKSNTVNTRI